MERNACGNELQRARDESALLQSTQLCSGVEKFIAADTARLRVPGDPPGSPQMLGFSYLSRSPNLPEPGCHPGVRGVPGCQQPHKTSATWTHCNLAPSPSLASRPFVSTRPCTSPFSRTNAVPAPSPSSGAEIPIHKVPHLCRATLFSSGCYFRAISRPEPLFWAPPKPSSSRQLSTNVTIFSHRLLFASCSPGDFCPARASATSSLGESSASEQGTLNFGHTDLRNISVEIEGTCRHQGPFRRGAIPAEYRHRPLPE